MQEVSRNTFGRKVLHAGYRAIQRTEFARCAGKRVRGQSGFVFFARGLSELGRSGKQRGKPKRGKDR